MEGLHEVMFNKYCKHCVNYKVPETEDPCDECLTVPMVESSHKPIHFESRSGKNTIGGATKKKCTRGNDACNTCAKKETCSQKNQML